MADAGVIDMAGGGTTGEPALIRFKKYGGFERPLIDLLPGHFCTFDQKFHFLNM